MINRTSHIAQRYQCQTLDNYLIEKPKTTINTIHNMCI